MHAGKRRLKNESGAPAAQMAPAKKPAKMSVDIPGEEEPEFRRNDPNAAEFERNKRVADVLQDMMSPTDDSVLKKQASMNAVDVEKYYVERLEKAKDGPRNPALNAVFARLESDMNDAIDSLKIASEGLDAVKEMDISKLPVRARSPRPRQRSRARCSWLPCLLAGICNCGELTRMLLMLTGHRCVGCEARRAACSVRWA